MAPPAGGPPVLRCKKMDDELVKILAALGGMGQPGSQGSLATKEENILDDMEKKLELIESLLTGSMAPATSGQRSSQRMGPSLSKASTLNLNLLAVPPSADELSARGRELRSVAQKEQAPEPDNNDLLKILATLYNKNGGVYERIAKECGADQGLMNKHPPKNADDFAQKLLLGIYTKAGTDITVSIGPPTASQLQAKAQQLKKTVTTEKEDLTLAKDELQAISGIFQRCGGDLEKIAAASGCSLELLRKAPPKDGLDFAAKLLLGCYTDAFAVAGQSTKPGGLSVLSVADLQKCAGSLKKVDLMTSSGVSLAVDIQNLQAVYDQQKGNLENLANICGVSFAALQHAPPADSLAFAESVLDGSYTDTKSEELRAKFGGYLMLDALTKQSAKLRSVSAVRSVGTCNGQKFKASNDDLEAIAAIWTSHDGDLEKIAKATGANLILLRASKPRTPKDFAEKLLAGAYVGDRADIARVALRAKLADDLLAKSKGLKKVITKDGEAASVTHDELKVIRQMFDDAQGDWAKLAAASGANADVLARMVPKDADTFATNMLKGAYVADPSDVAAELLRRKLGEQLVAQKGALKKIEIKEGTPGPMSTDVDIIGKIYDSNRGELSQIAAVCGIDPRVLKRSPPTDATDFATKLLGGEYTCR